MEENGIVTLKMEANLRPSLLRAKELDQLDTILGYNFFFKRGEIYMKDAECAKSKKKSIFRFFISQVLVIFVLKSPQFSMNF